MSQCNIYALTDHAGNIRYIGKTIKSLTKRFSNHLTDARRGDQTHRSNWIRSLLKRGIFPSIQLVGVVDGDGIKEEKDK